MKLQNKTKITYSPSFYNELFFQLVICLNSLIVKDWDFVNDEKIFGEPIFV